MAKAKHSSPDWHQDEIAFLQHNNIVSEQFPLSAAERVKERWIHNTLREVFLTPNGYVLKRYTHFPGRKDYRKVWSREHNALIRLPDLPVPETLGFVEVSHQSGTKTVLHLRTMLAGAPVKWDLKDDMRKLARLISAIHKHHVVTLDPQKENFIRLERAAGQLGFIDLGRARVFKGVTTLMLINIGKELAKLSIEGGLSEKQFQRFLTHYNSEMAATRTQQNIIQFSLRYWLKRHARKLKKKQHQNPA